MWNEGDMTMTRSRARIAELVQNNNASEAQLLAQAGGSHVVNDDETESNFAMAMRNASAADALQPQSLPQQAAIAPQPAPIQAPSAAPLSVQVQPPRVAQTVPSGHASMHHTNNTAPQQRNGHEDAPRAAGSRSNDNNFAKELMLIMGKMLSGMNNKTNSIGSDLGKALRQSNDMTAVKTCKASATMWERVQFVSQIQRFKDGNNYAACADMMVQKSTPPDKIKDWIIRRNPDATLSKQQWAMLKQNFVIRSKADTIEKACAESCTSLIASAPKLPFTLDKLEKYKSRANTIWLNIMKLAEWFNETLSRSDAQKHVETFIKGLAATVNDGTVNKDVRKKFIRGVQEGSPLSIDDVYLEYKIHALSEEMGPVTKSQVSFNHGGQRVFGTPLLNTHFHEMTTNATAMQAATTTAHNQALFEAYAAGQASIMAAQATPAPPQGPPPSMPGPSLVHGAYPNTLTPNVLPTAHNPFGITQQTGQTMGIFQTQMANAAQNNVTPAPQAQANACRDFANGRCSRINCRFTHNGPNTAAPAVKSTVCYDYMRSGTCAYGSGCRWSHSISPNSTLTCKVCNMNTHLYGPLCPRYSGCNRCDDRTHLLSKCPNPCSTCGAAAGTACPTTCPKAPKGQLFRLGKRQRTQQ